MVVKIGPLTYQIEEVASLLDGDAGNKLDGNIVYKKSLIQLEANATGQYKRVTLWHEIIHAILTQAGIRDHDEHLIEIMAHGVMAALVDNPWLGERIKD